LLLPTPLRREKLWREKKFWCHCERCSLYPGVSDQEEKQEDGGEEKAKEELFQLERLALALKEEREVDVEVKEMKKAVDRMLSAVYCVGCSQNEDDSRPSQLQEEGSRDSNLLFGVDECLKGVKEASQCLHCHRRVVALDLQRLLTVGEQLRRYLERFFHERREPEKRAREAKEVIRLLEGTSILQSQAVVEEKLKVWEKKLESLPSFLPQNLDILQRICFSSQHYLLLKLKIFALEQIADEVVLGEEELRWQRELQLLDGLLLPAGLLRKR